uniref:NADPH-dependent diflavin oxidoreductase 1 NADPH-dependent FMN and FAD-containing oxidoreductase n=1 Tax=Rhizophora mucronata TaxID=61149 RepID=A0A2P2JVW0_RHIMU
MLSKILLQKKLPKGLHGIRRISLAGGRNNKDYSCLKR